MVDKLFDELGNIATIFVVDGDDYKRIVTNIINERGERAVGTLLGKDSSAYPYMRRGEVYLGPAKILNKNYYTIYNPIKNQENRIIGVVFLGVERTHADELLNNTILNMAKATIIIVLIFTCIISILIVYFLRKIIVNPILEAVAFGKKIGELDLTEDIPKKYLEQKDEIGELAKAFNSIVASLRKSINKIQEGSNSISTSVQEINKANEELAEKSTIQASSLEETSATLEEISSIISVNTENIVELSKVMKKTQEKALSLNTISDNLKNSMSEIINSSNQMESIIDVIEEISFQANLLALNAAVEAARAGEAGKGFAVVAVEVRNLAKRSSDSSKKIKELIKHSENKINQGDKYVDTVIKELKEIVLDIDKTSNSVLEITSGAEEQRKGVEQIAISVAHLDDITQTNAGIAQETSSMSQNVYSESQNFIDLLKIFKIKNSIEEDDEISTKTNKTLRIKD